jgi:2-amino-4-hydroxy-6-hydroxymethyldihydropteridine diphosphokinase
MSSPSSTTADFFGHITQLFDYRPDLTASMLAIIGLGANLPSDAGEPAQTLRAVLPGLQALSTTPLVISAIIETEPDDCPPGSPRFANAVAVICPLPELTPQRLLEALQALEADFGRRRKGIRNEARPLDLDLVSYGDKQMQTPTLILPHPRAAVRSFVMQPLASIWPDYRFPGSLRTAAQISAALEQPS